jgi:hypothetical protein
VGQVGRRSIRCREVACQEDEAHKMYCCSRMQLYMKTLSMYKHKLSLLKFLQIFIHFRILAFIVVDEVDSLDGLFNMAALQHIFLIIG